MKNNILKENKLLIETELRDVRTSFLKKKEVGKEAKDKQVTPAEFRERLDFVMTDIEELHNKVKRNYEFTESI